MINKSTLRGLKLIVFDLDGTLLSDMDEVGNETIELVKSLRERGVRFSFASGRLHSAIIKYASLLNITTPLISLDGSLIKCYPEGKIIFESYISPKYVNKAIKFADNFLLKIALCHDDAIYYTPHNSVIPELIEKFGAKFQEVEYYDGLTDKTLEIVITGDYRDAIKYLYNKMIFPYSIGLNAAYYKSHSHEDIYYLEIRKKGCSKGIGLKRLSKYLKIGIRETAVLGDWYNDRSLFETHTLKIAVANAVQEIKYKADFVTKRTNNEDASAEFLQMVLESHTK